MERILVWWWFYTPLPVRMLLLWIFISVRLFALNFECQLFNTAPAHPLHMQQDRFQCRLRYSDTCTGELCEGMVVKCTRYQLLAVKLAHLTPDLTSHLREVGTGFDLPQKHSHCGGRSIWWGCCSLCLWREPTELAHSFLFCSCVCFCLYGHFSCISFHKFSRQVSAFSLCSSGLPSALLVPSVIYLFMKVSLSPDVILCGWLGLKHQPTN